MHSDINITLSLNHLLSGQSRPSSHRILARILALSNITKLILPEVPAFVENAPLPFPRGALNGLLRLHFQAQLASTLLHPVGSNWDVEIEDAPPFLICARPRMRTVFQRQRDGDDGVAAAHAETSTCEASSQSIEVLPWIASFFIVRSWRLCGTFCCKLYQLADSQVILGLEDLRLNLSVNAGPMHFSSAKGFG